MTTPNLLRTTRHPLSLDPRIPFLADALDCYQAQTQLCRVIPTLRQVNAATLVRHKPGRRALIEYQLTTTTESFTLLGKIRANGTDWKSHHLQQSLWQQGFAADSPDGYSVPQPIGIIPAWQMWLQRKVPGIPVTDRLPTGDISLAHRIAGLAHKLHCTPIPTSKTHTLQDELRILHERLPQVSQQFPQWQFRIEQVLAACDQLASRIATELSDLTGIHRDFYGDQILVDCDRMWLVDLDLYCQGSPALDIGNFIAHITEQSLRQLGNSAAMNAQEIKLRETFIETWTVHTATQTETSGSASSGTASIANALRQEIELYTVLTLVRHIHISTRIPTRRPYTESILSLCEGRLREIMQ
ncbi:MAG: phosphotransferase family protein [Thainema sp.]